MLQLYWLCMITFFFTLLKIQKGFSTILLVCNFIYCFSKYCIYLQHSLYAFVLVMCECVCYCAYIITVNQHVHVWVTERAKHSFFALPNPFSCSVMNKICLNQIKYNTSQNERLGEMSHITPASWSNTSCVVRLMLRHCYVSRQKIAFVSQLLCHLWVICSLYLLYSMLSKMSCKFFHVFEVLLLYDFFFFFVVQCLPVCLCVSNFYEIDLHIWPQWYFRI